MQSANSRQVTIPHAVVCAWGVAILLSMFFWGPLAGGDGLIGGDIYTYYFPQKVFLAHCWERGEFPLWNNLGGHGYPLLAESQTAPLYPFHLLAYSRFDVNSGYNFVQLSHYVLAVVFTWLYARRLGLSGTASLLAGLVYTYGWFPARICLEWAIITGAWLPAALWCAESFLVTRRWWYLLGLSLVLGVQLLAGHYNLAFITNLTLAAYVPFRLWLLTEGTSRPSSVREDERAGFRSNGFVAASVALAMMAGFALAAVQLVPSWELKQLSQRADLEGAHDPGTGPLPVWYWSQVVAPWAWYRSDVDLNAGRSEGSVSIDKVEAHLYFGLIPVGLIIVSLFMGRLHRDWRVRLWGLMGIAALIYATGWLLPWFRYVPGFDLFRGLGRYGIITTLAAAIIAGISLDGFLPEKRIAFRRLTGLVVLAGTAIDLWIVSGLITYAIVIPEPVVLDLRIESPVASILGREQQRGQQPVRLFSRGANLPTLLGVASTPVYLGIGPEAYFDPEIAMPEPLPYDDPPTEAQIDWLQRAGVTHVLSFSLLDTSVWPVSPVWAGVDPFLNSAWARREPLYLYELHGSRGRVSWLTRPKNATARMTEYHANQVEIETAADEAGELVLTDLFYPGWEVQVDGKPTEPILVEKMYRGVSVPAGKHRVTWRYRPGSVFWGMIITAAAVIAWLAVAHRCFWGTWWFPQRTKA